MGKLFTQFGNGIWNIANVPSEKWAKGVGGSILIFAKAMQALDDAGIDLDDPDDDDGIFAVMNSMQ